MKSCPFRRLVEMSAPFHGSTRGIGISFLKVRTGEHFPLVFSVSLLLLFYVKTYFDGNINEEINHAFNSINDNFNSTILITNNKGKILAYKSSCGDIKRQSGSVLKPLSVYLPAIESGKYDSCSIINDEKINLTAKEFRLLEILLSTRRKVFAREELLSKVWGFEFMSETRTVDVHITTLRKKIKEYGSKIKTHIGIGYSYGE